MSRSDIPFIEVKNLTCVFDVSKPWLNRSIERLPKQEVRAVNDLSISINKGETLALVGESGSGKSTIAKLLVGLLRPTSGSVLIDGNQLHMNDSEDMQSLRGRFQMIFQNPYASLNPRWKVGRIIAEPINMLPDEMVAVDTRIRVAELLELVGLSPQDATKFPHEFSGGQRQRIAIARALSAKPEFIVCDEPTSALDVSVQAQILNLMRDVQQEFGLTYLFISHDLSVVRHMANHIAVLYLGTLVENTSSDALFSSPVHPYTKMLLNAVPNLEMTARVRKKIEGEIPNPITPPSGCAFHPRCPLVNDRCKSEIPKPLQCGDAVVACHAVEEGRHQPL